MELFGEAKLLSKLTSQRTSVPAVGREQARADATQTLTEGQDRAPHQSGHLASTGEVQETPEGFDVAFTAPYALDVHEDTTRTHPNGQAKYLEAPFVERIPAFLTGQQEAMNRALES